VSILSRKRLRDLRRQWPQFAAVALTVALGVAGFVAARGAYLDLQGSTDRIYSDLRLADVTVTGAAAARVAEDPSLPGRPLAAVRLQADAALRIGDHTLLARLVSVPDAEQPAVDRLDVRQGRLDGDGALVEQHLADHFGLHPGSRVAVLGPGGWQELPVAAVVASPEYLWPARSRQEIVTDPEQFGVVFLPVVRLQPLAGTAAVPQAALYAQDRAQAAALVAAASSFAHASASLQRCHRSRTAPPTIPGRAPTVPPYTQAVLPAAVGASPVPRSSTMPATGTRSPQQVGERSRRRLPVGRLGTGSPRCHTLLRLASGPGLQLLDIEPDRLGIGVVGHLVPRGLPGRVQLRVLATHPLLDLVQLTQGLPEPRTERRPAIEWRRLGGRPLPELLSGAQDAADEAGQTAGQGLGEKLAAAEGLVGILEQACVRG
jgi:hypothetical protein